MTSESRSGLRRDEVLARYREHLNTGTARMAEYLKANVESRSRGAHVWDDNGERYLECGGYGVFILGHCHERVVQAVIEQVRSHPLSTRMLLNAVMAEAAEALARVAPQGLDRIHFGVSGADAVETALKLARLNDRRHVIAMDKGYHGKTIGALSVTGHEAFRKPFLPLLADIEFVTFGDVAVLEEALAERPGACVLLEPVQAEGGVVIPPPGYLREVELACRRHDAFLIVDEIQTGLGRLGMWWGVDREAITPDVLLAGKALSGGVVPVSAVVASEAAFHELGRDPFLHASTFSGAPIAMAAAKAAIEAITEEDVVPRAARLGETLRELVAAALNEVCPSLVRDVRGVGLLIAVEWEEDYLAFDFLIEMLDRRVILSHSMNAPRVSRLTPPVTLGDEDLAWLETAVRESAAALVTR